MLADALKSASDTFGHFHDEINSLSSLHAGDWMRDVEVMQEAMKGIAAAGAGQDPTYKLIMAQMSQEHAWAAGQDGSDDKLSASDNVDLLERLQTIERWQGMLHQISATTMAVMQPYAKTSSSLARGVYVSRTPSTTPTKDAGGGSFLDKLPAGTGQAMGIGAGVGAAIVGAMAGLATGSAKVAVGAAVAGAVVGAGAGYYAHNGLGGLGVSK